MAVARLEIVDLSLAFGGVTALDRLTLTVEPGELLGVIGPNGAGKSSLVNCITNVYRPTAGEVRLDGQRLTGKSPSTIAAAGIASTFQNLGSFDRLSVLDNIMLGRHHLMSYGVFASLAWFGRAVRQEVEHRRHADAIIELLELEAVRSEPVGSLPYGVQKRVELARALAAEARLLLLDEPVAGMNQHETEDMAHYLLQVRAARPMTIVLIEHDLALVMDLADRVAVLDFGSLVTCDCPDVVRADPAVRVPTVDDVAGAVSFLLDDTVSGAITGQVLSVNAGFSMRG